MYQALGQIVPIRAQPGMGAISVTALDVMQRHTRVLPVLARDPDGAQSPVNLRVPVLGAYVLNKAATFAKPAVARSGTRELGFGQTRRRPRTCFTSVT